MRQPIADCAALGYVFGMATGLFDQRDDPFAALAAVDRAAEIDGIAQNNRVAFVQFVGEGFRQFVAHLPEWTVAMRLEEREYAAGMRFQGAQRSGTFFGIVAEVVDHRNGRGAGADDVEAARADDALATCVLTVRVPRLGKGDRLDVTLNGEALPWETARVRRGGWTRLSVAPLFWADYPTYPEPVDQDSTLIEFDVGVPPLRKGINTVEIRRALLGGPDPIDGSCAQVENTPYSLPAATDPDGRCARSVGESVVVEGVEITVAYREKA